MCIKISNPFNIGCIGTGNMLRAMILGWIKAGIAAESIIATRRNVAELADLQRRGVHVSSDNHAAVRQCKLICIGVKPHMVIPVITSLRPVLSDEHIVVSIAAGISIAQLEKAIARPCAVYRLMPNMTVAIHQGVIGMVSNAIATQRESHQVITNMFQQLGVVLAVADEQQLHALTALCGSGAGFCYALMQPFIDFALAHGFNAAQAQQMIAMTFKGAGTTLFDNELTCQALLQQVVSPNGTTEAGIKQLKQDDAFAIIHTALAKATQRSIQLGNENK